MSFKISLHRVGATLAALIMVAAAAAAEDAVAAAAAEDAAAPAAEPSMYSASYLHPAAKHHAVIAPPLHQHLHQQHQHPYDDAVASTYANVVRVPGHHGPVVKAVSHKTVDTPFSSAHKSDVRYTNDGAPSSYYPAAGHPYPYAAVPAAGPLPYAGGPLPYAGGPHAYAGGPHAYAGGHPHAYAAGPLPYPGGPHAYAAGPHAYAGGPHAYAGGPLPYAGGPLPYPGGPLPYATPYNKAYGYGPTVTPAHHSYSHASYAGPYGAHYSSYTRR